MSTARSHQVKRIYCWSDVAPRQWCPRQDSNLRFRLRRPETTLHYGVSGVPPGLSPDHRSLRWIPCRVVESTIDSTQHRNTAIGAPPDYGGDGPLEGSNTGTGCSRRSAMASA